MTNKVYIPTHRDVCEDPKCPCFREPLVGMGYGYPVCPSSPERIGPNQIRMNPVFMGRGQ